ncbi:ERGIC3 [Cordylochernes scorpioides]|uniref:Endoplasmic reticulum-Golgi intermediate compartment protein 3 n=1 Tax=Cordylochernes scorpioides TaxID=51811 RepID=A0ABY6L3K1_9ARAC|nr:ERGIC3 [Cordylochernes scorpioides]
MLSVPGGTNYQYFIKVVPTMFARLDGHTLHTNQFAVTRHSTSPNSQGSEQVFPGVFFSYEIAPMMVKYSENYK